MTSQPTVDTATLYCCITSDVTSAFAVTGVSLQRVLTFGLGNGLPKQCLQQKENLQRVYCSYSGSELPESLVSIIFNEDTSIGKKYNFLMKKVITIEV